MRLPQVLSRFQTEVQHAHQFVEQSNGTYFLRQGGIRPTRMLYEGRGCLNLASNSYHALGQDPEVKQAAMQAIEEFGTTCGGSPVLNNTWVHVQLERAIEDYLGMPAILLSTGFNANAATIGHLVGPGETLFSDERNHASIWAGCKAIPADASCSRYPHCDVEGLRRRLDHSRAPALIVTDSVFSMAGDLAPLREIADLCEGHGVALMVDEAHGFGIYGRGRGLAAELGVRPTFMAVTMSKSLASVGGIFCGPADVVDTLRVKMKEYLFSANLPAANVAAALKSLEILKREPWRIDRLHAVATRLRLGLREFGLSIASDTSPIVSVLMGSPERAFQYAKGLLAHAVFVNPVKAPGVPKGKELLRCTVNSQLTEEEIDEALDAFQAVVHEHGLPDR